MSSIKSCKACGADNDVIFDNCMYCKKPLERTDVNVISNEELISKTGEWIGKSRSVQIILPPPEGKSAFWASLNPSILTNGQIRGYAQKYLSMLAYRASQNHDIKVIYDDLQSKYNHTKTSNPTKLILSVIAGLMLVGAIGGIISSVTDNSDKKDRVLLKEKEKQRIEQVISEVRKMTAEKDLNGALLKSSEIMWASNLVEDSLLVRQYNLQREEIQKTIQQLKSEEKQE